MVVSTVYPSGGDINIFPGVPNWRDRVRVSYEFKTDIITSGLGTEQRRAVRYYPRRYVEYTAHFNGESKLQLDYFMARGLADKTIIPEPSKYVVLTSTLGAGQRQVSYGNPHLAWPSPNSPPYWLRPGLPVLLVDGLRMETRLLSGFSFADLQFADESQVAFPVGTRVYPALQGYLRAEPKARRYTSDVTTLPIRFEVDPGSATEVFPETSPGEMIGTREVFMKRPNWGNQVDVTYVYPREQEDYGFGATRSFKPYDFPSRIVQASFLGRDHREVQEVIEFFIRMRGRDREFLVPSWENDVPFYAITGNGFAILIPGLMFGHTYKDSTVFRRIMLRMADGTYHHHTVDFVETLPDTEFSVLWVRERLPVEELTPQSLIGISWVFVVRFASDLLEIDWVTDSVAQFGLSYQVLENYDL